MATKEFLRKMRQKYHLGEYRTAKGLSKPKRSKRIKRRQLTSRGGNMAKRHRTSSGIKGFGGSKLTSGIFRQHGLIGDVLIGAGTATLAENLGVTNAIPYGKYVAGGLTAGVGGVAGVIIRDMIKGTTTTSSGFAGY